MKELSEIINHLGEEKQHYYNAIVPPIIQSSNFSFESVHAFRSAFEDELGTHLYTRGNNPTVNILRQKIAALEHTEDALIFSSGAAAIAAAVIANVKKGDHVICVQQPYSWTHKLIGVFLNRFGVEHSFVDGSSMEEIELALKHNSTLLMLESPNSLTFEIQDLKACAEFAQKNNLTTVIDNSFSSPLFQNPADFGIDIVVHSGSKYLGGHSDVVFGALCASKKMISHIFGSEYMTLGGIISPHDAWLVLRSLRTLELRLNKSEETANQLCSYLKEHPKVKKVIRPLDPSFPQFQLASKQMKGCGGLFSVEFKSDALEKMESFSNALCPAFQFAVSWGGHESLQVPTCVFYNSAKLDQPRLPFTFARYYVGLESYEYLKNSFEQALELL